MAARACRRLGRLLPCRFSLLLLSRRADEDGKSAPDQLVLEFKEHEKTFDPKQVYGDVPNPTVL